MDPYIGKAYPIKNINLPSQAIKLIPVSLIATKSTQCIVYRRTNNYKINDLKIYPTFDSKISNKNPRESKVLVKNTSKSDINISTDDAIAEYFLLTVKD